MKDGRNKKKSTKGGRNEKRRHVEREVNPGHLYIIPLCGHFAPITQPAQLMDSERWRCGCCDRHTRIQGLLYYGIDSIVAPAGNAEVVRFTSGYTCVFTPGL